MVFTKVLNHKRMAILSLYIDKVVAGKRWHTQEFVFVKDLIGFLK